MTISSGGLGSMVRGWRERRRWSQADLALAAEVPTRQVSFIETGRAIPSRSLIERLCDELSVPLRDRNAFFLAAGLAPLHRERPFDELAEAGSALDAVLEGHEPNPAAAVNSHWELITANQAMTRFIPVLSPQLAGPPLNLLRTLLHPDGLAGQLLNPEAWRTLTLRRVRQRWEQTADPLLAELLTELESYPPSSIEEGAAVSSTDLATPLRLKTDAGELSLFYTVTVFGSPRDITLDEITIETFFPADATTRAALRRLAES